MKSINKILLGFGVALTIAMPLCMKDTKVVQAYAEEPQVEETTPSEEQPPLIEENTSSEEVPPVEEPSEPQVPVFETKTYIRRADETHYEELTLETETRYTMTYHNDQVATIVKGTYVLNGEVLELTEDAEYEGLLRNDKLILAPNGTFKVYVPAIGDEDFTFEEIINYLFTQAWFYLPLFVTLFATILVPTICTIAKIVSNSKTSLLTNKKMVGKTNEIVSLSNNMAGYMNNCMQDDLVYWKAYRETLTNKKQIAVVDQRIAILENRIATIGSFNSVVELKADELNKKVLKQEEKAREKAEKVKVRVKIVDGE